MIVDTASVTSADSEPSIVRPTPRATSPGRALQDVTARLQAMRLGISASMHATEGDGASMHHYCSGEVPGVTAPATAGVMTEGTPVEAVMGEAKAATSMAADMQDIDERLANLQTFLLATKASTG